MSRLPVHLLTALRPSPCRLTGSLCATAAARRLLWLETNGAAVVAAILLESRTGRER